MINKLRAAVLKTQSFGNARTDIHGFLLCLSKTTVAKYDHDNLPVAGDKGLVDLIVSQSTLIVEQQQELKRLADMLDAQGETILELQRNSNSLLQYLTSNGTPKKRGLSPVNVTEPPTPSHKRRFPDNDTSATTAAGYSSSSSSSSAEPPVKKPNPLQLNFNSGSKFEVKGVSLSDLL